MLADRHSLKPLILLDIFFQKVVLFEGKNDFC